MIKFKRKQHQVIEEILKRFNSSFFKEHQILFGGGTRIALELDEFRQSVDIDFLCPNRDSFRAVRLEVSETSLGRLVDTDFIYPRAIRTDRDAIRGFVQIDDIAIKLEFIIFADYQLLADHRPLFPVPAIDQSSCYLTKLLANADRYNSPPYKDIFDLLAMFDYWGEIPYIAWEQADHHYGFQTVFNGLENANQLISANPEHYIDVAVNELDIAVAYANKLIYVVHNKFRQNIQQQKEKYLSCLLEKNKLL